MTAPLWDRCGQPGWGPQAPSTDPTGWRQMRMFSTWDHVEVAPDYYADARALASDLADAHLPIWAQRIEKMTSGSTGTEILMGLRWTLDQLVETEAVLPEHLRSRATSLADALEAATS